MAVLETARTADTGVISVAGCAYYTCQTPAHSNNGVIAERGRLNVPASTWHGD